MSLKGKLVFDTTNTADSDSVGAYLRSSDGTLITHTNVGGNDALDVNVSNTVTVTATDLDIRDLTHVSDSIKIGDGTDFLAVNADGSINVNADISVVNGFEKAEDAAHASGDIGGYMLSVRQDSLGSSTSTDGDYQSFKTDSLGRLYTFSSGQTAAYGSVSVINTATDIVGTDLVNRRKILIQNADNRSVFIGSDASVTALNGIRLDPGAGIEFEVAAGVNLHGITASGSANVRYFEIGQ